MSKVIFLDIDGVLNSIQAGIGRQGRSFDYEGLDKIGIQLLKEIVDSTGAKIVISSTWRSDGIEAIKGAFATKGWSEVMFDVIIGVTDQGSGCRGDQINRWILANPECTQYVIIDDDRDMLEDQKTNNFVHVDSLLGFNIYDAYKVINILGVLQGKKPTIFDIVQNRLARYTI